MKKILMMILTGLLLIIVGCNETVETNQVTITFEISDTFSYTIGDEAIDYLSLIEVKTSTNINLIDLVTIDDLSVDYLHEGTYEVYFSLFYDDVLHQKSAVVTVKQKSEEVTLTFEVPNKYVYTIGDDEPNYIENITANYSNGIDLIQYVTFDDSLVNYDLAGSYTIYFYLIYEDINEEKSSQVEVRSPNVVENITLNIYYVNDFHGAILNNNEQMGLANIGNLIIDEKTKHNDSTLFISGGDMLQGQLISNYYDGASTIELLNDMDLDAFVVGNHEFDWGIDVVTQYFNGTNALQASFPLLGANVYDKSTNSLADGFEPYTIIEKSGIKIAVIGTMGYGLESSIAYARIQNHKFIDPIERTAYYAKKARVEDGAQIVLAVNHMDSSQYNEAVANFRGDERVDAIFNAHTHQQYIRQINQTPIIQSGANGSHVGKVTLHYNTTSGVTGFQVVNLNQNNEPRLNSANSLLEQKIENFYLEINGLYEPIMVSGQSVSRGELATYIAKLMQVRFNTDVGLHNYGGTRDSISYNEDLSYAKLHTISPFDNTVIVVNLTGYELLDIIGSESAYYKEGLTKSMIVGHQTYTLALNDYIFGSHETIREKDANYTGITVLDLFVQTVELQSEQYETWNTNLPIMFGGQLSLFTHLFTNYPQISI